MFQVIIHQQAKDDITRNASWWAENHSLEQALLWLETVERQLERLDKNPERFATAPENGRFAYELRQVHIGRGNPKSYRAVFTIQGNFVHVLAVQRAQQDELLNDDLPKSV